MITLRIKEIIEEKDLSPETLSNGSSVPLNAIQAYITSPTIEGITDIIAEHLRKIAKQLNVSVIELVKPVTKKAAFKLNIFEIMQQKQLTLNELSERSGVHPAILAFYSTQPICEQKLSELELKNKYLIKISEVLDCSSEDLKIETERPIIKLGIEEWAEERGLNKEDMSILTELPLDFIDLLYTQYIEKVIDISQKNTLSKNLFFLNGGNFDTAMIPATPGEIFCHLIKVILAGKETWICR